jgi:hypothetical protein
VILLIAPWLWVYEWGGLQVFVTVKSSGDSKRLVLSLTVRLLEVMRSGTTNNLTNTAQSPIILEICPKELCGLLLSSALLPPSHHILRVHIHGNPDIPDSKLTLPGHHLLAHTMEIILPNALEQDLPTIAITQPV